LLRFGEFVVDGLWTPLPGLGYCEEHAAVVRGLYHISARDELDTRTRDRM
jgi:hypothetical protein